MKMEGVMMCATELDYYAYEESIEGYAEYFKGEIYDKAGGSENHSSICQNLSGEISSRLGVGGCRVHGTDLRLRIDLAEANVRPDVWVICGKSEYHLDRKETVKNPILVAEVLSKSTSIFDHNGKFDRYLMVPSLREYVMVEQDVPQVDVYFKNDQGILEFRRFADLNEEVYFQSLGFAVPMIDIYRNVDFDSEA
jgi:Uma2 family endonuclease